MGKIIKKFHKITDGKTDDRKPKVNTTLFAFTTVAKEELERRRVPVYPYLL